jgi:hypothetical protein
MASSQITTDTPNAAWTRTQIGTGRISDDGDTFTLTNRPAQDHYTNAQITDYNYHSFRFRWQPPLRMTLRAHASSSGADLRGTAGFGFWNHPFSPDVRRVRLPQAIWFFFGSPPNDMQLAHGIGGNGWKAATIDAGRNRALMLTPLALPTLLLMQVPALYRLLYPPIQRALAIGEAQLDDTLLSTWHTYTIDWLPQHAVFRVDNQVVLDVPFAPRGACGFCAWIDNQYAIVTPQGRFGGGIIPLEQTQSLLLQHIDIRAGDHR